MASSMHQRLTPFVTTLPPGLETGCPVRRVKARLSPAPAEG